MADKKSKYIVSSRDKISSIGGDTTRNLHESFASEFLKYADEYNVHPFPRIVQSFMDLRASSTLSTSEK
ncbi:hypothetical protein QLX08_005734 [Tetragonisca angustula]|uniref:Uncharacterized protein n=1 Tax=Tetragonisca angustula TaxID=166442 RepID=A0AAW0ZX17_9HYME